MVAGRTVARSHNSASIAKGFFGMMGLSPALGACEQRGLARRPALYPERPSGGRISWPAESFERPRGACSRRSARLVPSESEWYTETTEGLGGNLMASVNVP